VHPAYHVCNNYLTYTLSCYFSLLRQFRRLPCVATMSSPAHLQFQDGYQVQCWGAVSYLVDATGLRLDLAAVHEKDERSDKTRACVVKKAHRQYIT